MDTNFKTALFKLQKVDDKIYDIISNLSKSIQEESSEEIQTITAYTEEEQEAFLNSQFKLGSVPDNDRITEIANTLGCGKTVIKVWFSNKKRKEANERDLQLRSSQRKRQSTGDIKSVSYSSTRGRSIFNEEQRSVLNDTFEIDPYPEKETVIQLSEDLEIQVKPIVSWFERERSKRGIVKKIEKSQPFSPEFVSVLDKFYLDKNWVSAYEAACLARDHDQDENKIKEYFGKRRYNEGVVSSREDRRDALLSEEKERFIKDEWEADFFFQQSDFDRIAKQVECDPFYVEFVFRKYDSSQHQSCIKNDSTVALRKMYREKNFITHSEATTFCEKYDDFDVQKVKHWFINQRRLQVVFKIRF